MVVSLGICCMEAKLRSQPMLAILNRLRRCEDIVLVLFPERHILERRPEQWPIVDFLICFYSTGFPLDKAEAYVALRQPICVNDVAKQYLLLDREIVYRVLQANGVPVPRYRVFRAPGTGPAAFPAELDADMMRRLRARGRADDLDSETLVAGAVPGEDVETLDAQHKQRFWGAADPLHETEESIVVDGETFRKPFVEKPVSAENHNIYIYYPPSSGGGSKRLFRKVKDRSSKFVASVSTVRRAGAYIYEEFIGTDGMDIKVYTVGPDYAHAEARKAPTVDGRVQRRDDGREVRYHVILNKTEKEIARRITEIFGQNVCGFDLLRTETMSYVCDVNGLSFVKGAQKYYNDFALVCFRHSHPTFYHYLSIVITFSCLCVHV